MKLKIVLFIPNEACERFIEKIFCCCYRKENESIEAEPMKLENKEKPIKVEEVVINKVDEQIKKVNEESKPKDNWIKTANQIKIQVF